jgi:hypothetical protein
MDKAVLRSTLKKLRALPLDPANHSNVRMAPQEMLDFLAARAGLKPVFLIGRGFDDAQWIAGAVAIAQKAEMRITEGPFWDARVEDQALPGWFRDGLKKNNLRRQAFYITKTVAIADTVQESLRDSSVTMDLEASLLGYPSCCVRAHYERDALLNAAFFKVIERVAKGDVSEMQRLLREDDKVMAETEEERVAFQRATTLISAPFTSFHMCQACTENASSPAQQLSGKYHALALAVDKDLTQQIEANQSA